ncbi:MAG: two pore domain potassium channel family protein [Gammaproteobacteria bacterium]|nr:two pore domain potassium channel family protein [Gammaproteobacteria bacterium]
MPDVIVLTVVFHVTALVFLANLLTRFGKNFAALSQWLRTLSLFASAVLYIIGIHTIEAWSWAGIYMYIGEFESLSKALYFSVVTTTTLGYGDIVLSERWQLLSTFEAMGGLILFGASTAFLIGLMRHLFEDS